MKLLLPLLLTTLHIFSQTKNLALQINQTALDTKETPNLYRKNKKVYLYGIQTNGADTDKGRLACAKVVSIILMKAGVKMSQQLGVAGIEQSLQGWQKISNEDELRPGDVVIWTSNFKGNANCACTGGGTCHVGIYTSKGYFHNDPLHDKPIFNGIGLWFKYKFKVAYRPA